ncbi:hypothetical protein POTOM_000192 [Populus tomentosa]|uniref:Brix domain-containing protein n=1 Tax=Populus tomentosa TaxID=118781 RepID=A0A8X8APW1_POPTO|nr:hypothetical protein POTOM_000192 [Populus tomentosa]
MLRRNIRLRREYLYRKSLEGKERLLYEKKRKIKEALAEGKPIPTELRNEEAALRQEIDLEDENTAIPRSHIDDEYAKATERDPKILLTTSRDPSAPLTQFVKELKFVFPNAERINRGGQVFYAAWEIGSYTLVLELKFVVLNAERINCGGQVVKKCVVNRTCCMGVNRKLSFGKGYKSMYYMLYGKIVHFNMLVISEIIESCRAHDYTDVILVHEHRGVPDGLVICHLPFGPTAYFELLNVVTRHDIKDKKAIGTMPEAPPHLILNNFKSKLGERTANILKHLFPMPKPDTKRIITFANQSDYISFRHHIYEKHGGPKSVELKEIGPRFEMRLYQIKLGTVDQTEAQNEWVLRPYMNTTKKQKFIGD